LFPWPMVKKTVKGRPRLLGILGLAALNLLLFGDVLFNGKGLVLSSDRADLYLHFVAWREFAFSQLKQGHLVLWNPHYLCGSPFFGGFEAALLYPLNWFYLILPLALAINFGIALHVFLAGSFTYLWAYHRGLHPLACFLAGTVFMFGGAYYLHVYAGHLPNLCTMAWAPLIFLAIDGLLTGISLGWVLLGVFAVAMQILAGHPQYLYFTAIIAAIYTTLNLIGHKDKLKTFGAFTLLYIGASLLTAVQLWTGLQALQECGRNIPLEYRSASSFFLPPENLLTLFMPEFFGNLGEPHYWGRWFLWEVSLFIGGTSVFLAVLGLVQCNRPKSRWIPFVLLTCLAFSFGIEPLYWTLYHFVPGFNGLRGIGKFDFLASLFMALLTAMGLDRSIKSPPRSRWPEKTGGTLFVLMVALGLWVIHSASQGSMGIWGQWQGHLHWLKSAVAGMTPVERESFLKESGRHSGLSLLLAGSVFGITALLMALRKHRSWTAYGVAGLAVLELFIFARMNRPTFELSLLQEKFGQFKSIYEKDPGDYRVYGTASASLVTGGYDLWEDEPMVLGRYGRFVCASQGLAENQLFSVLPIYKKFTPIFGLLRLKYVFPDGADPSQVRPTGFNLAPRMFLVQDDKVLPETREVLDALLAPGSNPAKTVLLEEAPDPVPGPGPVDGMVSWKDLSTDRIEISVQTSKAAILVVTDNYSSGWRVVAYPDSVQKRYRILPADGFLRAIALGSGRHHFLMTYQPASFILGKWVSILSCFLYVGILCAWFRRERP